MYLTCFLIVTCFLTKLLVAKNASPECSLSNDLTATVASVLCVLEKNKWFINKNATALTNAGCLIGGKRCQRVMRVPKEDEVPPSPLPPKAKNEQYQALALKAERVVPQTWWRRGFANDMLLLSHNVSELPRKLFDARRLRNKKLGQLLQCVTRQQFIRKSFSLDELPADIQSMQTGNVKCAAMKEPVVITFHRLWKEEVQVLIDGDFTYRVSEKLLMAALEVLDHFYAHYGQVWTGCFKLDKYPACRGALAAAAMVSSLRLLFDIAGAHREFSESSFTAGYMLSSLGRGLLHGHSESTGNKPLTVWKVKLVDFIALQAAYMKLYTESFGKIYNEQLDQYIPLAFPPSFPVHAKKAWRPYALSLEPVYTSLRNWMFTECANLIDFGPYRPLVSFPEVRKNVMESAKRRVLIDVGANGFFASPKYLLDSYSPFLPFTHAVMIEPEPHFSATVPESYSRRYNISYLPIYAEVATGSDVDMLQLLPSLVTSDDFVVLKFDVDPNRYAHGPTMEWGFLFSLMQNPNIAALVDELYIELHFSFPSLSWLHYHSNWEALDAIRYLRSQGAIVHSWP